MDGDGTVIQILVDGEDLQPGSKSLFDSAAALSLRAVSVNTSELAEKLRLFCVGIDGMFQSVTSSIGQFELESFEITAELTAKGEVRLVGSVGTEIKGGLKLIFRRRAMP